ncbi:DinB family protein [Paenibacillus sp. FSL R5-0912]|uniref:DinB family protein n=1 Tax=Paenibacillus sp. FSL R5-0912 TaxID=1536771 RepID=UPI000694BFC4|nr:DinB family protein [Paenibacillus sp. FSL R5-0912]
MLTPMIAELQLLLAAVPAAYNRLTPEEAAAPRRGGKWSCLQLLGHLCDSAINNLTRFIKVQYEPQPLQLAYYDQNEWMNAQHYASAPHEEVLTLWISLNQSVLRVISRLSAEQLNLLFLRNDGTTVTLQWLVEEYVNHMKHHLRQMFPEQGWDSSAINNLNP